MDIQQIVLTILTSLIGTSGLITILVKTVGPTWVENKTKERLADLELHSTRQTHDMTLAELRLEHKTESESATLIMLKSLIDAERAERLAMLETYNALSTEISRLTFQIGQQNDKILLLAGAIADDRETKRNMKIRRNKGDTGELGG